MTDPSSPAQRAPDTLTFPCSACGADLAFAPGAEALVCPYCNHREAIARSAEEIVEHPFESYQALGKSTGWGATLQEIHCDTCGASFQVEPQVTSADCPFCGSSQVKPQETRTDRLQPESVVPFAVTADEVLTAFRAWLKKLWFRPSALKKMARTERHQIRGMYIPFWTFDALTQSYWDAEAGYYYYVTESYEDTDAQGNPVTRTREVRHTRWEPASGAHSAFFDDVLVPASRGIDPKLARKLAFQTGALAPYRPEYLVGMGAEDYQVDMPEAWPEAKGEMDAAIYRACERMVPGDTNRNLRVRSAYHNRSFKLCLLPIWVASYRYRGESYRFLCNGQTGAIAGDAPLSWVRIVLFAAALLALVATIIVLSNVL